MMEVNILLRTSSYRGDHSADVALAYQYQPNETIESLIQRCGLGEVQYASGDCIEIRICTSPPEVSK